VADAIVIEPNWLAARSEKNSHAISHHQSTCVIDFETGASGQFDHEDPKRAKFTE